jgi:hypothetical protein
MISSSSSVRANDGFVRVVDDPATGDRWVLERDAQHPGGPGRMVLVAQGLVFPGRERAFVAHPDSGREAATAAALIHAGDHLIVEEHTRLLDAVLEAIALGSAKEGGTFRVRLSIGGQVLRAVAVAPGRALLSPDLGVQP